MSNSAGGAHAHTTAAKETFSALIVDNSVVARRILRGCIEHITSGPILEAGDGGEALQQLREHPDVKLVFLDWSVPGIDGITVLKEIRSAHDKQSLLVIMVTGLASKDNVVEALRAGANHYIIRPVVQEKVIEIVNATISKYRAA